MNPEFILIRVNKNGDCWNWKQNIKHNGYGTLTVHAHRLSFLIFKGSIPKGMVLHHKCKNRQCVNPEHLEVVTKKFNTLEGNSKAAINSRKTHCPNGHKYDVLRKGRRCSICEKNYRKRKDVKDRINRQARLRYKKKGNKN